MTHPLTHAGEPVESDSPQGPGHAAGSGGVSASGDTGSFEPAARAGSVPGFGESSGDTDPAASPGSGTAGSPDGAAAEAHAEPPVPRSSVVDTVVDRLRTEILAGAYRPGQYLPAARELAARFGITRTSLKHALVRLAQSGLLETKHGVGTRVMDYERRGGLELLPTLLASDPGGWVRALFEVRTEIGALIAVRAAHHATAAQRRRLGELAGELRAAADASAAQLVECEWHRELARASGNRVYPLLINVVLDTYLRQRHALAGPFHDPAAAADRLDPLAEAVCRAAEPGVVHAAATRYLDETGRLMMDGQ